MILMMSFQATREIVYRDFICEFVCYILTLFYLAVYYTGTQKKSFKKVTIWYRKYFDPLNRNPSLEFLSF